MAISGAISAIRFEGYSMILSLVENSSDPVGQGELTVLNYTVIPDVGDVIWGGSDEVRIEGAKRIVYTRQGYTKLVEARIEER